MAVGSDHFVLQLIWSKAEGQHDPPLNLECRARLSHFKNQFPIIA